MTDQNDARTIRANALRRAAQQRTEHATRNAEKGIRILIRDGGQISFAAVARAGGVSTKFLHHHPDLAPRIRSLAAQQRGPRDLAQESTLTGDNAIIAALRRRLREQDEQHRRESATLRSTIADQQRQIAALYGQMGSRGVSEPSRQ